MLTAPWAVVASVVTLVVGVAAGVRCGGERHGGVHQTAGEAERL